MRGNSLRTGPRPANSMEQDSFDSFDDCIEDMLVNSAGNMRLSPNSGGDPCDGSSLNVSSGGEEEELPKTIIVTNVDLAVFDNDDSKVRPYLHETQIISIAFLLLVSSDTKVQATLQCKMIVLNLLFGSLRTFCECKLTSLYLVK